MRRRYLTAAIAAAILLAACSEESEPERSGPTPEPVVVYAAYTDMNYLPKLFRGFTEDTGIPVVVRHRTDAENLADLLAKTGSPPADVLLANSLAAAWDAAEDGALRPMVSETIDRNIPAAMRDPDGMWTATAYREALIVYNPDVVDAAGITDIADLGGEDFKGKLCLSSSSLSVNRSLIAMMIARSDVRPAEIAVRYWMQNLALPPQEDEGKLLDSIEAGTCGLGIVSSSLATMRAENADYPLRTVQLSPAFIDAEVAGVSRHARYPESALKLVEWMTSEKAQQQHAMGTYSLPANPATLQRDPAASDKPVLFTGLNHVEATKLAERAGYR